MPAEPLNGMPRMSEQTAKVKTLRVEREKPTDKQTSGAIRAHTQKRAFEWKTPRLLCKSDRRSVEWKLRMHQGNAYVVRWLNRMFICAKVIHSYVYLTLSVLPHFTPSPPLTLGTFIRTHSLCATFASFYHLLPLSWLKWACHLIWFSASCYSLNNVHTSIVFRVGTRIKSICKHLFSFMASTTHCTRTSRAYTHHAK